MFFDTYIPAAPLSDFVENFWAYEFNSSPLKEQIFPTGTFEFVFNLRDDKMRIYKGTQADAFVSYSGAIASGPYSRSFVTDTALEAYVMGVHFKPGGAFPFLRFNSGELRDTHIDLQMIWGRSAVEIREQPCGQHRSRADSGYWNSSSSLVIFGRWSITVRSHWHLPLSLAGRHR